MGGTKNVVDFASQLANSTVTVVTALEPPFIMYAMDGNKATDKLEGIKLFAKDNNY